MIHELQWDFLLFFIYFVFKETSHISLHTEIKKDFPTEKKNETVKSGD